jgi:hypothetical protein
VVSENLPQNSLAGSWIAAILLTPTIATVESWIVVILNATVGVIWSNTASIPMARLLAGFEIGHPSWEVVN